MRLLWLCEILKILMQYNLMSLHFFLRPAIASVLLWGAVTPAAISSEDEAPLTVLGLSIGQSAADILPALSKTDFKPAQQNARKGRSSSAKLKQFGYETATGDKVVFEIAARQGGFDAGLIIGLNYAPARPSALRPGTVLRLKSISSAALILWRA